MSQPAANPAITAQAVIEFLHHFEAVAMQEDFALLLEMIDEHAYFRFNDGDFIGRAAIQAAFERTWRGDPTVTKARRAAAASRSTAGARGSCAMRTAAFASCMSTCAGSLNRSADSQVIGKTDR